MASTPMFKVYDADNQYVAAMKDPIHAGVLVDWLGDGATIRYGHGKRDIVWTEGDEDQPACESWDHLADIVWQRVDERGAAIASALGLDVLSAAERAAKL